MNDEHLENDLRALKGLLDLEELSEYEREAFDGMLANIMDGGHYRQLTHPQREWAMARCDALGIVVIEAAERNKDVPRGREVPTPAILQNLPKTPPRKRA